MGRPTAVFRLSRPVLSHAAQRVSARAAGVLRFSSELDQLTHG